MLICIENVLTKAEVAEYRARLDALVWRDGAETAGSLARHQKRNLQVDDGDAVARDLGDHLLARLQGRAEFVSAALPKRIFPPKFNRYQDGGTYGAHVDGAVMISPRDGAMLRSDLSATVFLAEVDQLRFDYTLLYAYTQVQGASHLERRRKAQARDADEVSPAEQAPSAPPRSRT